AGSARSSRVSRFTGLSATASSIQNVLPRPSVLSAPRLPPIASTNRLERARPSPVPSIPACSAPRRSKGANSRSSPSGGMPGPVSITSSRSRPGAGAEYESVTVPPSRLYLIALERKFNSTCLNRCASARTCWSGASDAPPSRSLTCRSAARGFTRSRASRTMSRTGTGSGEMASRPPAIRHAALQLPAARLEHEDRAPVVAAEEGGEDRGGGDGDGVRDDGEVVAPVVVDPTGRHIVEDPVMEGGAQQDDPAEPPVIVDGEE